MSKKKNQPMSFEEFKKNFYEMIDSPKPIPFCGWDGGNDSGYYSLEPEFKTRLNKYFPEHFHAIENCCIELADDALGFGSFTGQFYTEGTSTIDKDDIIFEGTDEDSDGRIVNTVTFKTKIDNSIAQFNAIIIEDNHATVVTYNVPLSEQVQNIISKFESEIKEEIVNHNLNIPYVEYFIEESIEVTDDGEYFISLDLDSIDYPVQAIHTVEGTESLIELIWNQIESK